MSSFGSLIGFASFLGEMNGIIRHLSKIFQKQKLGAKIAFGRSYDRTEAGETWKNWLLKLKSFKQRINCWKSLTGSGKCEKVKCVGRTRWFKFKGKHDLHLRLGYVLQLKLKLQSTESMDWQRNRFKSHRKEAYVWKH